MNHNFILWLSGFLAGIGGTLLVVRLLPIRVKLEVFVRPQHSQKIEVHTGDAGEGDEWKKG